MDVRFGGPTKDPVSPGIKQKGIGLFSSDRDTGECKTYDYQLTQNFRGFRNRSSIGTTIFHFSGTSFRSSTLLPSFRFQCIGPTFLHNTST